MIQLFDCFQLLVRMISALKYILLSIVSFFAPLRILAASCTVLKRIVAWLVHLRLSNGRVTRQSASTQTQSFSEAAFRTYGKIYRSTLDPLQTSPLTEIQRLARQFTFKCQRFERERFISCLRFPTFAPGFGKTRPRHYAWIVNLQVKQEALNFIYEVQRNISRDMTPSNSTTISEDPIQRKLHRYFGFASDNKVAENVHFTYERCVRRLHQINRDGPYQVSTHLSIRAPLFEVIILQRLLRFVSLALVPGFPIEYATQVYGSYLHDDLYSLAENWNYHLANSRI